MVVIVILVVVVCCHCVSGRFLVVAGLVVCHLFVVAVCRQLFNFNDYIASQSVNDEKQLLIYADQNHNLVPMRFTTTLR